MDIGDWFMP